jgi:DNA-binding PadR family transcriptional regulator
LLAALRLKEEDRHLSKIVGELESGTSRWITAASVFTNLGSMKKKGYLTAREEVDFRPGPGRKKKMVYQLTSFGEDALNLAVRDIITMTKGLPLWGLDNS